MLQNKPFVKIQTYFITKIGIKFIKSSPTDLDFITDA